MIDICTGQPVTIRQTIDLRASIIGTDVRPDYSAVPDRPMDQAQIGDPRLAGECINWRTATELPEGLRKTAEWYAGGIDAA